MHKKTLKYLSRTYIKDNKYVVPDIFDNILIKCNSDIEYYKNINTLDLSNMNHRKLKLNVFFVDVNDIKKKCGITDLMLPNINDIDSFESTFHIFYPTLNVITGDKKFHIKNINSIYILNNYYIFNYVDSDLNNHCDIFNSDFKQYKVNYHIKNKNKLIETLNNIKRENIYLDEISKNIERIKNKCDNIEDIIYLTHKYIKDMDELQLKKVLYKNK